MGGGDKGLFGGTGDVLAVRGLGWTCFGVGEGEP